MSGAHGLDCDGPVEVVHIGLINIEAGGVTRVANQLAAWNLPGISQQLECTSQLRGRVDDLRTVASVCAKLWRSRKRRVVVHAHIAQEGMWREGLVLWWAKICGIRTVTHMHGSRFAAYTASHRRLVWVCLRPVDVVLALTQEIAGVVGELFPHKPVRLIHNYEEPVARVKPMQRRVVFAGVVGRRKGADTLVEAWARIPSELLDQGWTLELCGPPDPDQDSDYDPGWVEGRPGLRAHGRVPREEVMELLSSAAIAALPSRAEAFPMFLLESMAGGAVPVGTDVGDVARLIGDTGPVCAAGDVDALTEQLTALMRLDLDELERRGRRAAARVVEHWSRRALERILVEVWTGPIDGRQPS